MAGNALIFIFLSDRTKGSSRWVFVHERKTWSEAQSYCRQSYTDLASIRNLTENEEIRGLISDTSWIGLFRDAWKWSDGSTMSFSKWDNCHPSGGDKHCATSHLGKWRADLCSDRFYFACYSGAVVKMQVVKVRLQSASSADLEVMKDALLQQLRQRLKDQGVSDDVQLRWVTQPDGRVFHKEGKEEKDQEEQAESCGP
ncbi:lithostathine-1-beta-like [Myripristis murdjan]|uniref:lithostathine-1-beta-like n=1 Tax=Myripristis murdjan TaxID=586833 RepID=UPI001175FCF9|nr:lithostathine-1-beta-like [Myripristis murdjan]